MAPQLAFRDLTLGYDRHPAVHHLDGVVTAGSLLAVVGPNGGGKSTLLKGIAARSNRLAAELRTVSPLSPTCRRSAIFRAIFR